VTLLSLLLLLLLLLLLKHFAFILSKSRVVAYREEGTKLAGQWKQNVMSSGRFINLLLIL
jgi:hypothetical protein